MNILIINGVNLKMLGIREPQIYGNKTYKDLLKEIKDYCKVKGVKATFKQSDIEGEICKFIQKAYKKYDGIIINAGAYTHTSVAILDSLKAVGIKTCEVHLSDINEREDFRKQSYISLYAQKTICGLGFKGYLKAIDWFLEG